MARKLAAIAFSLGCLHAGSVLALGLGEVRLESFLNEPLKASVDLLNMGGLHEDEIKIRLATTEDFDKLGLDRNFFLTNIRFDVVADGQGGARILISSEEPVLEPYLDFIVEARWPSGRLIREYTVLVDPQVFSQATPVVSASQRVAEVEGIPAPAKKNEQAASGASQSEDATIGAWGTVGGGGTRVDVRESNLTPGAMPERGYNATTAATPTPGSRYMISRDQTLWDIASRAKPAGASVHQTMLDIQRLNPDAFINGNINRIKAGYIIYLPSASDISSGEATALSEVSQQNQAWREGRDGEVAGATRPKLTISADSEEDAATATTDNVAGGGAPAVTAPPSGDSTVAGVTGSAPVTTPTTTPAQGGDTESRLADLEQQLQDLQRIVALKDNQIATLQAALAKAGGSTEATPVVDPTTGEAVPAPVGEAPAETIVPPPATTGEEAVTATPATSESGTAAAPAEAPKAKKPAAATKPAGDKKSSSTPDAASSDGWTSYILYALGALVLAVGGFILARRRGSADEDTAPARPGASREDVFSTVRLPEKNLVLEPATAEADESQAASPRDNRGYGERKHDEYASDVDSADALAEADIYIAYGRHQQAIDLLNNALANEPNNPVYRLKLIEIYSERKNRIAAATQMEKLQNIGDSDSIARAESLMAGLEERDEPAPPPASARKAPGHGPGLSPNPLKLMEDSNDTLEADFSGLEIEGAELSGDDEDLDLSSDFGVADTDRYEDEELVIAADSNGLSTKLDLARAYLDMGDDDGARQILDEVVAEGSEELQAEARLLLNRIGG